MSVRPEDFPAIRVNAQGKLVISVMAGVTPTDLSVDISGAATGVRMQSYGFTMPNGDTLYAVWTDGTSVHDDRGMSATLTFPGLADAKLPEGRYELTVLAAGVTDVNGKPMGADYNLSFHVLAGDVNGDGADDVLVGAPFNNGNGADSGRAYVLSGYNGATLHKITGRAAGDRFGASVTGIGDLDNDGLPDISLVALDDETFREMAKGYPAQVGPMRELRHTLGQMRLHDLAVGSDDRNRAILSAFRSATGRNQPSNSRFVFGPSAWLRSLISPEPGRALAYVVSQLVARAERSAAGDRRAVQLDEPPARERTPPRYRHHQTRHRPPRRRRRPSNASSSYPTATARKTSTR